MFRVFAQTKGKLKSVDIINLVPNFRLQTSVIYFRCITDPSTLSSYRAYLKKRKKIRNLLPPLDPFNVAQKSISPVDREEIDRNFDSRIPLPVIKSLKKFSISPKQVSTSALGNDEQRVAQITEIVSRLSDETTYLERVDIYRALLLKYSLVKLDTTKVVLIIKALIQTGLDPARMLERQPIIVCLDPTTLANQIESLLQIIRPERSELKFNYSLFQELKRLASYASNCTDMAQCEGTGIVYRLYQSGSSEELSALRVYKRVFDAIKSTVLAGEYADTEVYRDCSAVYNRLIRFVQTGLCLDHFKEAALGLNEKCLSDVELLREDGLGNNKWVGRFLKSISATKILLSDSHRIQQLGPQLALLEEYGIDVNNSNLHKKCPMLLNTPVSDLKKSMEILGSSPFYCNKNDIYRVFVRDPSIFTTPAILERSRQQLEKIPLLKQRQISWHNVIKQTPKVLTIRNYARIFKLLLDNKFSNQEIITTLEYYPSIFKQMEAKIEKFEIERRSYKPYVTKIGLTTLVQFIKKRIAQETAERYHGYSDNELVSPEKHYSDWGAVREEIPFESERGIEDRLDNDDI